jgi:hypothetical protein
VAFLVPPLAILPLMLGWLMMMAAGIWFLVIVFQIDVMSAVLCFLCGWYALYFLCTHFQECKRPFYLNLTGVMIWFLGLMAGAGGAGLR